MEIDNATSIFAWPATPNYQRRIRSQAIKMRMWPRNRLNLATICGTIFAQMLTTHPHFNNRKNLRIFLLTPMRTQIIIFSSPMSRRNQKVRKSSRSRKRKVSRMRKSKKLKSILPDPLFIHNNNSDFNIMINNLKPPLLLQKVPKTVCGLLLLSLLLIMAIMHHQSPHTRRSLSDLG